VRGNKCLTDQFCRHTIATFAFPLWLSTIARLQLGIIRKCFANLWLNGGAIGEGGGLIVHQGAENLFFGRGRGRGCGRGRDHDRGRA
jgi:hypothetical protein